MVKNKYILGVLLIAAFIVVTIVSVGYGIGSSKAKEARHVDFIQGVLAYNHFKEYQEIELLVEQKCYTQAFARAKFNKDTQSRLLADYLKDTKDSNLEKYVADRDAELLRTLNALPSEESGKMIVTPCLPNEVLIPNK